MNDAETESLFERIEIAVSVQERVSVKNAKRGNQAVDSLADGSSLLTEPQEILCCAYRQFLAAGIINLKPAERIQNSRENPFVCDTLKDLAKNEIGQSEPLKAKFAIEVVSFAIRCAAQIVDPNRRVNDDHSTRVLSGKPSEARAIEVSLPAHFSSKPPDGSLSLGLYQ